MATTPPAPPPPAYWLTRFVFLRLLGFLYFVAFVIAVRQFRPLAGEHGLLPAPAFLEAVGDAYGHGPAVLDVRRKAERGAQVDADNGGSGHGS